MKKRSKFDDFTFYRRLYRRDFGSLTKQYSRRDKTLLDSGFYDTETWGGLKKCWKGYRIAKVDGDTKKLVYYAEGIRKFERELSITVTEFPQLGLLGRKMRQERDSENYFAYGNSCAQTEKELAEYEQQEQAEDRYRTQQEPDLRKEQEYVEDGEILDSMKMNKVL